MSTRDSCRLSACFFYAVGFVAAGLGLINPLRLDVLLAVDHPQAITWVMGNCNMDGKFDISDAISAMEALFSKRERDICATLCDVTGDGEISISDPILIMNALFLGRRMRVPVPAIEELCDGVDNDCNGQIDEGCPDSIGASVLLAWDPVKTDVNGELEDAAGYEVHFGQSQGGPGYTRDAHRETEYRISNLVPGAGYYITVTAYDQAGNSSPPSNEVFVIAGR